jgi:hypothetical protein
MAWSVVRVIMLVRRTGHVTDGGFVFQRLDKVIALLPRLRYYSRTATFAFWATLALTRLSRAFDARALAHPNERELGPSHQ